MKKLTKTTALLVLATLLMLLLSSCGSAQDTTTVSADPMMADVLSAETEPETVPSVETDSSLPEPELIPMTDNGSFGEETGTIPEPETAPAADSSTSRQDGERFQDSIMLEGMPEAVFYEHVKNDVIGIELDYDYENFERRSGSASECFISKYDNADAPENYLEIFYTEEDSDSAAASIAEGLSANYAANKEAFTLKNAGACTRIDASSTPDGQTPDQLQTVYIIPLQKGCAVATAHYSAEAAEGFGHRFAEIMDTLTVMSK